MYKLLVTTVMLVSLLGCNSISKRPPAEQIVKDKNVAVVLGDEHFVIPMRPVPGISREQAKELKPRDIISLQTDFIGTLLSHIKKLEVQITGIKSAQDKLASEIEKGVKP